MSIGAVGGGAPCASRTVTARWWCFRRGDPNLLPPEYSTLPRHLLHTVELPLISEPKAPVSKRKLIQLDPLLHTLRWSWKDYICLGLVSAQAGS